MVFMALTGGISQGFCFGYFRLIYWLDEVMTKQTSCVKILTVGHLISRVIVRRSGSKAAISTAHGRHPNFHFVFLTSLSYASSPSCTYARVKKRSWYLSQAWAKRNCSACGRL